MYDNIYLWYIVYSNVVDRTNECRSSNSIYTASNNNIVNGCISRLRNYYLDETQAKHSFRLYEYPFIYCFLFERDCADAHQAIGSSCRQLLRTSIVLYGIIIFHTSVYSIRDDEYNRLTSYNVFVREAAYVGPDYTSC